MQRRVKWLLSLTAFIALVNAVAWSQVWGLFPEFHAETEQVTVYEHGKPMRLDAQLMLYPSLVHYCEQAVKISSPDRPGVDLSAGVAAGRQGDAIEIVYATPRKLMVGSRTFVVDHLFIALATGTKDPVALFVGQGGYQDGLAATKGSVHPSLKNFAFSIAAVQARRDDARARQ